MNRINNEIIEWIRIDDKIKDYNMKIKELKELKDQKYDNIYEILELEKKNIEDIPKYKIDKLNTLISFNKTTSYSSLTYRYLEKCLVEYFKNDTEVQKVIDYIKENREIENKILIKRDNIM
tara:strand:+ start:7242 stop:7604 length:363 start_codon:yes stop_codon:yes gene_type:complete